MKWWVKIVILRGGRKKKKKWGGVRKISKIRLKLKHKLRIFCVGSYDKKSICTIMHTTPTPNAYLTNIFFSQWKRYGHINLI